MVRDKFCSRDSLKINESLFGTAAFFRNILLIEYGMPFGTKAIDESHIHADVKSYLKECLNKKTFDRILLIRNDKTTDGVINVFAVANKEDTPYVQRYRLENYDDLCRIDFSKWEGESFLSPLYLVCTNGKKDKCCSKFGLPLYNLLKESDENVWQCSHIGGDRFAPNVIVMPYGHFYGHLQVGEQEDFLAANRNNTIYFPRFRGRSCYKVRVQAAFNFLRAKMEDFSIFNFKLLESNQIADATDEVIIQYKPSLEKYKVVVNSEKSEEKYFLTCKAEKPSRLNILNLLSIEKISQE